MSEAPASLLLVERHGPVTILTLNRPDRHHALNGLLSGELEAALHAAEGDHETRAVIITGSGSKAFCAGADMLEVSGVNERQGEGDPGRALQAVASTHLPVVAAIGGYCFGAGAALAMGCDIRLASESASFRFPGSEYGLVVGAAAVARLVGPERAKEIVFTARRFTAAEALAWGLVSRTCPPDDLLPAAIALAHEIAANAPAAVQAAKRVIDAATLSAAAVALEGDANRRLRESDEHVDRFRSATRRVTGQ